MSEPLVSVLTPVYNGEQYLRRLHRRVLAQTYQNWEYIIVTTAAPTASLDIAREYAAAAKPRNPGSTTTTPTFAWRKNYNLAFRQIAAESKYCKAVASDDMILPECLERMVRLAEAHRASASSARTACYSDAAMGVYSRGVVSCPRD